MKSDTENYDDAIIADIENYEDMILVHHAAYNPHVTMVDSELQELRRELDEVKEIVKMLNSKLTILASRNI